MNIIIANTQEFNPQIGGVERTSSILANELARIGHNVFFVAYIRSPFSKEYTPVVEQLLLPNPVSAMNDENVYAFAQFVKNKYVQIILNEAGNILNFNQLCVTVKKKTNVKLITAICTTPDYRIKQYLDLSNSKLKSQSTVIAKCKRIAKKIYPFRLKAILIQEKYLYQYVYDNSEKIVLLSKYYKPVFHEMSKISDYSKLVVISNPLSFNVDNINARSKEKQLLFVGRLDYFEKRPDKVLEIWALIFKEFPDWELIMLGNGPARNELIELSNKLKLKRVTFEGFQDPKPYYKNASIILMTSTIEGLPMVLIEAAQYGVIPIAFDTFESLKDIIDDGVNGYRITSPFIKQSCNALKNLMTDSDLRICMANASTAKASQFALDKIVNEWVGLFLSII